MNDNGFWAAICMLAVAGLLFLGNAALNSRHEYDARIRALKSCDVRCYPFKGQLLNEDACYCNKQVQAPATK